MKEFDCDDEENYKILEWSDYMDCVTTNEIKISDLFEKDVWYEMKEGEIFKRVDGGFLYAPSKNQEPLFQPHIEFVVDDVIFKSKSMNFKELMEKKIELEKEITSNQDRIENLKAEYDEVLAKIDEFE